MQSYKFDEVIKRSCEKNDLNYELMRSFSDHIFSSTKKEMSKFDNLRIYLRGMFSWFYGFKRLHTFDAKITKRIEEGETNMKFLQGLSEEEVNILKSKVDTLKNTYAGYIEEKREIKTNYRNESKGKVSSLEE